MNPIKFPSFAIIICLFALLLVAPASLHVFSLNDQGLVTAALPSTRIALSGSIPSDLDGDGHNDEIVLTEGRLEILSQGLSLWRSSQDWQITKAQITDFNQDLVPEVTLLLWRDFSPWPIDSYIPHPGRIQDFQNQEGRSCHLVLLGYRQGVFRELWAGSALANPLLDFASADLDHDGDQELIALESRYDAHALESTVLTVWEWNGFGFTLLTRGPHGYFPSLHVFQTSTGKDLLLLQGIFRR
jgi:hypothetical protein